MEGLFPETAVESEGIRLLIAAVYMGICALQDLQTRRISLRLTVCAGTAAAIFDAAAVTNASAGAERVASVVNLLLFFAAGFLPGALLLILSLAAEGAAGKGDGFCFLVLGALLGPRMTWMILLTALFLASLCGIILMILKKAGRKTRMPFLVFAGFALAGNILIHLCGIIW